MTGEDLQGAALAIVMGGVLLAVAWWRRKVGDRTDALDAILVALAPAAIGLLLLGVAAGLDALGVVPEFVLVLAFLAAMVGVVAMLVFLVWMPDWLEPPDRTMERAVLVGPAGEFTVKVAADDQVWWVRGTFPDRDAARQVARDALGGRPGACATLYEARADRSAAAVEVLEASDPWSA